MGLQMSVVGIFNSNPDFNSQHHFSIFIILICLSKKENKTIYFNIKPLLCFIGIQEGWVLDELFHITMGSKS